MNNVPVLLASGLSLILAGCSTSPIALAPVGPNPAGVTDTNLTGELEVYSALQTCRDGNEFDVNPPWHQHTDYTLYNMAGRRIRHVFNNIGHYDEAPRVIPLPPAKYLVKAQAKGYLEVVVPVLIQAGHTTRVHLDDKWKLSPEISKAEIVSVPNGYPVGWRATPSKGAQLN